MKLTNKQVNLIKEASEILDTGYDENIKDNEIEEWALLDLLEDLMKLVWEQEEQIEELEQDLEDRPVRHRQYEYGE